jgi:hypothetical protein
LLKNIFKGKFILDIEGFKYGIGPDWDKVQKNLEWLDFLASIG